MPAYDIDSVLLDRYQVFGYREGKMSVVYFVSDLVTGRELAAKTYKSDSTEKEKLAARFRAELEFSLARGEHENLLTVRFIESVEGQPYLFTDYVDGGEEGSTLLDRLRYQRIGFPAAVRFAHQMTRGMEFLNSRGAVAHLDLKPSNILVTREGQVKISDFGLARSVDPFASRPSPENAGSIPYMSPEQFQGGIVDTRSDIYAFGVIFFEMLIGRHPFGDTAGMSKQEIYERFKRIHASQELGLQLYAQGLPDLPSTETFVQSARGESRYSFKDLGELIGACIDREPHRRFYNFTDVRESIEFAFPSHLASPASAGVERDEFQRGLDLQKIGDHSKALRHFNKALKSRPEDPLVLLRSAVSLWHVGLRADAVQFVRKASALAPENIVVRRTLADLERKLDVEAT